MERGRRVSEYAEDGTVDLKGNHVLKAKTGAWKASSFLLGNFLLLLLPFIIISQL